MRYCCCSARCQVEAAHTARAAAHQHQPAAEAAAPRPNTGSPHLLAALAVCGHPPGGGGRPSGTLATVRGLERLLGRAEARLSASPSGLAVTAPSPSVIFCRYFWRSDAAIACFIIFCSVREARSRPSADAGAADCIVGSASRRFGCRPNELARCCSFLPPLAGGCCGCAVVPVGERFCSLARNSAAVSRFAGVAAGTAAASGAASCCFRFGFELKESDRVIRRPAEGFGRRQPLLMARHYCCYCRSWRVRPTFLTPAKAERASYCFHGVLE